MIVETEAHDKITKRHNTLVEAMLTNFNLGGRVGVLDEFTKDVFFLT